MEMLLQLLGCHFAADRPDAAPSLKVEGGMSIFVVDSTGVIFEEHRSPDSLLAEEECAYLSLIHI